MLRGAATMLVGPEGAEERVELTAGDVVARVAPEARRLFQTGSEGARLLIVGGTPGRPTRPRTGRAAASDPARGLSARTARPRPGSAPRARRSRYSARRSHALAGPISASSSAVREARSRSASASACGSSAGTLTPQPHAATGSPGALVACTIGRPGGDVVPELVGAHAVAIDAEPLPAEEGRVAGGERRAHRRLGDAPEHVDVRNAVAAMRSSSAARSGPSPQTSAATRSPGTSASALTRSSSALAMPIPPAYPTMNVPAARSEAISSACAAGSGSASPFELLERDPVRDMDVARAIEAARDEVLVGRGQDRDDEVGVPAGVALGAIHRDDERVARRHAAQLDRRQRPEVVHLEDEPRAGALRDRARAVDVQRVRRGSDDDVGPELRARAPLRARSSDANETMLAARRAPLPSYEGSRYHSKSTPSTRVERDLAAEHRIVGADVRRRSRHDPRLVTGARPFARKGRRPELHPEGGRSGVLVDQEDPVPVAVQLRARASYGSPSASASSAPAISSIPAGTVISVLKPSVGVDLVEADVVVAGILLAVDVGHLAARDWLADSSTRSSLR